LEPNLADVEIFLETVQPDWMADWMEPFARTIDAAKKYVVSNTLMS
jgi:hypothetical protein